jgi:hypothetical protein
VILQAETFTPGRIAASSLIEVTLLRMDDARIALGQSLKARIAIA